MADSTDSVKRPPPSAEAVRMRVMQLVIGDDMAGIETNPYGGAQVLWVCGTIGLTDDEAAILRIAGVKSNPRPRGTHGR